MNSQNKPIQLGLCCLNCTLREQKPTIFASRSMIIKSIKEKGIEVLKNKILQNLDDVIKMIHWNEKNGIKVFRLSSDLFPHKSNPKIENYSFDFAEEKLLKIGKLAKKYNQRLTFHPGQYNVVGTPNEEMFQHTIDDLLYHATVFELMEMDHNSVLVVHGGGLYGNKQETKNRWCRNFKRLPEIVRNRLVLECCERIFSIKDCLEISEIINIPIVFDTHHFECYKKLHPEEIFENPEYYIPLILKTWERRNIKPKFHVSEQGKGRIGHHSDFVEEIPEYLRHIPYNYGSEIDIMIEAKKKEKAIFKIYQKYPELNCLNPLVILYKFKLT